MNVFFSYWNPVDFKIDAAVRKTLFFTKHTIIKKSVRMIIKYNELFCEPQW